MEARLSGLPSHLAQAAEADAGQGKSEAHNAACS